MPGNILTNIALEKIFMKPYFSSLRVKKINSDCYANFIRNKTERELKNFPKIQICKLYIIPLKNILLMTDVELNIAKTVVN